MHKILLLFAFVLIMSPFKAEAVFSENHIDIIVAQNYIWRLTAAGKLKLYNVSDGKAADNKVSNSAKIIMLVKDAAGVPVIADKKHDIKRYHAAGNDWETIGRYDSSLFGIVFDSRNQCYIITAKGIQDLATGKYYFTDHSNNFERTILTRWAEPSAYYIDRNDNIWVGFDYGEWGADLLVFNTINKEFVKPDFQKVKITYYPVQSFFEDSVSVYVSTSLMHMDISGALIKFEDLKGSYVIKSESHLKDTSKKFWDEGNLIEGDYFGPGGWCKF
jgi:hypothetical protein